VIHYLIRRTLYSLLVLLGVNFVTFFLFFSVNTPDDMARMQLGDRRVTADAVTQWKAARGYDKPLYFNSAASGLDTLTDTVFFQSSARLAQFDFGKTNDGREIRHEVTNRIGPTVGDAAAVIALVALMSISSLFFIIAGQWIFAVQMRVMPLSGYAPPPASFKFLVLPVVVAVLAQLGPNSRLYRTIFLEELGKDHVRTARAKGLSEITVLLRHVLRNSLIPIITSAGLLLPPLFAGSILIETFFAIPGLGMFTIDGINYQDFNIVRAMVFLGSFLYVATYLLTDFAYAWSDPRVRLQ
jgi:peptide/nickel transport system permease protein